MRHNLFVLLTGIYLAILLLVCFIACFFSYRQRKELLISDMDYVYVQLEQEYANIVDNFWQLYMPIFEKGSTVYNSLLTYFTNPSGSGLTPFEKNELATALHQILLRDNQVQWIALYSDEREDNYIMFNTGRSLRPLPEDFPYLAQLRQKNGNMEIYGTQPVSNGSETFHTFAICGATPFFMEGGKLMAGYSTSALKEICNQGRQASAPGSLTWLLTTQNGGGEMEILFQSGNDYEEQEQYLPDKGVTGNVATETGKKLYVRAKSCGNATSMLSYQVLQKEMMLYAHRNTPLILIIVLAFAFLSICIYAYMLRSIIREVELIRGGLMHISENHLNYHLPTDFRQNGFSEIAESINQMTDRLNENIRKAYYYELKQKESELAELQSKFNPHFLYNSLEMLRSRCYQSGDNDTAELITDLAGIFRSFIGSETFIPLPDELAFTRKYLSLFAARYRGQVQFFYDVDSDIMQYGIIRNLFQPLIENYFIHGIVASDDGEENYICIHGKSLDENMILFTVEDNGCGMSDDELRKLNDRINEPVSLSTESYGLKNIQQRLRLFYGDNCGLTITHNIKRGLSVQMRVLKITCGEYKSSRQHRPL